MGIVRSPSPPLTSEPPLAESVCPDAKAMLEGQNRILELIARDAPLVDTLEAIALLVESQAPETLCSVLLLHDGRLHHGVAPHLPTAYSRAVEGLAIGPNVSSCGTAAFIKRPVIVTDIATDPRWRTSSAFTLSFGLRACWSTPILANADEVLGTFAVYSRTVASPKPHHLELIEVATHLARIAIERHLADERLKERADQLIEADRRKDEFIALLAHELRNPLAPILMALEVMRLRNNDAASLEKYRDMMSRQVHHLKRLVDDLLDVSRITRGKIALQREWTTVDAFCKRAIELTAPLVQARRHRLRVDLPDAAIELDADPIRMTQVMTNLINNAAIHSPPSSEIHVSATRDADRVVIRVRDTGVGMDRRTLARAFDLFAQGDAARAGQQGGLGVGLALVRSIVEMHGGRVEAFSEGRGKGSELVVTLPLDGVARMRS